MDSPILSGSGLSEASTPEPDSEEEHENHQQAEQEEDAGGSEDEEKKIGEGVREVIEIIKNVTTLCNLMDENWTSEISLTIQKFIVITNQPILLVYFKNTELTADFIMPSVPVPDIMYFLRTSNAEITADNFFGEITFGNLIASMEGSVLALLQHLYSCAIFENTSWPEGVKGEFFSKLHNFLSRLTDLHFKLHGLTVLYVPHESLNTPVDVAAGNKELIQRLEGIVMHWSRQLRVAVGDATQDSATTLLTPKDECLFWEYRWECLNLVLQQLETPDVKHVVDILAAGQSSYLQHLRSLKVEILECIAEAESNINFLEILMDPCEKIDLIEKPEVLTDTIPDLLNLIRYIWTTSSYYNTEERITSLLKYLVNQVIRKCADLINLDGIFDEHITRGAVLALRNNIIACKKFRLIYDEMVKAHNELGGNWYLDSSVIFGNLDSFVQRNFDLIEISEAMITFGRMDETEIPKASFVGTKGIEFDRIIDNVENEFKIALLEISKVRNHILDVLEPDWQLEILKFRAELRRLELLLLNLLSTAIQLASTVEGFLMTLYAFYNYSRRPAIYRLFEEKTVELWNLFLKEIHVVRSKLLSTNLGRYACAPTFAGPVFLVYLHKIRLHRVKELMDGAIWLPQVNIADEVAMELRYIDARFTALSKSRLVLWSQKLKDDLAVKFERPLIRRSVQRPGLLENNFDLDLLGLMHELTYWQMLNTTIPQPVQEIFEKCSQVGLLFENVHVLVLSYNAIISALSDEERLLFRELIRQVDSKVGPGLFRHTWNMENYQDYINDSYRIAAHLMTFVCNYKAAISEMLALCESLTDTKMVSIPSGVIYQLSALEEHMEECRTRAFLKIVEIYEEFLKHLLVIWAGLDEVLSVTANSWQRFIFKLDQMMEQALLLCVKQSMKIMLDALKGNSALIHVSIHLEYGKISFKPKLERISSLGNHFLPEVGGALKLIPRVSSKFDLHNLHTRPFHEVIDFDRGCKRLQAAINNEVATNVKKIQEYLLCWEPYRRFWEEDKRKFIDDYEKKDPSPSDWDTDIGGLDAVVASIHAEEGNLTVHFTRLNCGPLKLGITQHCSKWKKLFCNVLLKKTEQAINDIFTYCDNQTIALAEEPKNLQSLQSALAQFETLSKSTDDVAAAFPKIQDFYAILLKNDFPLSPELTDKLKKKMYKRWDDYLKALKKASEMLERSKESFKASLMEQAETGKVKINDLVTRFKETGPFDNKWTAKDALRYLNELQSEIQVYEKWEEKLKADLALFDIGSYAMNRELKSLEEDVKILTAAWTAISDWFSAWAVYRDSNIWKLKIDDMEDETEILYERMRQLGVELQEYGWNIVYVALENIEAVRRCLPLLTEIRNPAMRQRHWKKIETIAGKWFDSNALTLADIFNMKLYEHGNEIYDISKTASLELDIENNLKNMKEKWDVNSVIVEPYKDMKGLYRLLAVDDIVQDIEDHMSSLTSMKGTGFASSFLTEIEYWEKTLSTVDEGLELIATVQRQWLYLENIFAGDDIRVQIPTEAAIFDELTVKWRKITSNMHKNMNAVRVCHVPGLFTELHEMLAKLEAIQKGLAVFLEGKRHAFPRFYFISNDDLLEILGNSKTPEKIQPHLKKLFDNISSISTEKIMGKTEASAMTSSDGETVHFLLPILCEGPVEIWLADLESSMKSCLKSELKNARILLKKAANKRDKWIKEQVGQVCITASQIQWTVDCTRALMSCHITQDRTPLKKLKRKEKKILHTFTDVIRTGLSKLMRLKVVALITIEIHARDVVDNLYKANCSDVNAFEWTSQLRFYWDKTKDDCVVRQTNTCFNYAYEYLGNSGRLVITPLTDRCYITLTTALHLHRGGSPKGPAGTGKTETVKDLGKALAAYVIVFNCSEGLDYKSMGRLFSGLAQSGAWGCFDEFNRINIEVLSVVAQQISSILTAVAGNVASFDFEGSEINLAPSCGIFVTMNPGYAGRTELPDNLKAMFRPISMVVPDSALIAEVTLYAEGFHDSKSLANKVVTLFSLSVQQLSKQNHYDFGLRGLVSILRYAGMKRRALPHLTDAEIVLLAMHEMNVAKLTASDLGLFTVITKDLFPGVDPPFVDFTAFRTAIADELHKMGLQPVPAVIDKVVQLFETQSSRHSVMMVGNTCTGKSTTWRALKATLSALTAEGYHSVFHYPINPKTLSLGELFGEMNLTTGQWMDGVISAIMRRVCSDETPESKWIVFDGPVDAVWIENMNSAMDDNKILTLINSERISIPDQVSLLFEVEDLSAASPATVSRAGMVYTDYSNLTWRPYVLSWLQSLKHEILAGELRNHFDRYMPKVLEFKRTHCTEIIAVHELACVRSLCRLLEILCVKNVSDVDPESDRFLTCVKLWFLFCLLWTVCGTLDEESRRKFDAFIRETESVYPVKGTIYEYFVDMKQNKMSSWASKLDDHWFFNQTLSFHEVVVPTVDTIRYDYLMSAWVDNRQPLLVVGPVGCGKSCIAHWHLKHRKETVFCASLSASTSSKGLQDLLESRLEKRTKGIYGPAGGRNLVAFLDDFNMPAKDVFGSQPPLELIRQWLGYGFWYDRQKQWKRHIRDVWLVAAMGPPGGGRNQIPNRLLSLFNVIGLTFPSDEQINRIYCSMLKQHLSSFDEEVKVIAESLSNMTVALFFNMVECMLPTPKKMHYLFNLRNVSRVFQGLLRSHKDYQNTPKRLLTLWAHEVFRVFSDPLVDDTDRKIFIHKVDELVGEYMECGLSAICPGHQPPVFGNFMTPSSHYEEITNTKALRARLERAVKEYNQKPGNVPLSLVFFRDAIDHVCRIARVISQERGDILLVGVGGSGRSSLAKLALFLCNQRFFSITVTKKYGVGDFREDLKLFYRQTGVLGRIMGFHLDDSHFVAEEFLEIVNSILSTGEVPNLYRYDELEEMQLALTETAAALNHTLTSDNVLPFLIDRARRNMHIILTMNPHDDHFRVRLMRYPALVSCTTIDWYLPWPNDALVEVAEHSLKGCNFSDRIFDDSETMAKQQAEMLQQSIAGLFADMHSSVDSASKDMLQELGRVCYVTPSSFLNLLATYLSLLSEKRTTIRLQALKLRSGLGKIAEAQTSVSIMSAELELAQGKVFAIREQCGAALTIMDEKRNEVDEQAKIVKERSDRISEEELVCRKLARAAQDDLDEALPALEEALVALDSLSKKDISELKSYGRPPPTVMMVMEAVCILKGITPDWSESKRLLGEHDFLKSLKEFDKDHISEKTMKKIAGYTSLDDFDPEKVESVSLAARSLCMWVIAIENYGKLWRVVGPKKARLDDATISLEKTQEELSVLEARLNELKIVVDELNVEYTKKNAELEALEDEANKLKLKLERAGMLVNGLADEKLRWELAVVDLEAQFDNLIGDCLVPSAFLSYAGPFVSLFRKRLINEWTDIVNTQNNLKCTEGMKLLEFLIDPAVARDWSEMGLPIADYSIENGVLVAKASRYPLIIDPQLQANQWLKNLEKDNGLTVLEEDTPQLMNKLEMCILNGNPVLLENVSEHIEPSILSVLNKTFITQADIIKIKLGDKLVPYNTNFRIYVTTKLPNPVFSTEVATKTTIVNFLVKQKGLEAQLLGLVVRHERPELEDLKTKTLQTISSGRKTLMKLEAELLHLLYESKGSLLENEQLFQTLQESRSVSANIKEGIKTAEVTEKEIETARAEYVPCATRSAILFMALNDLQCIDPMYQFSLDSYLYLFSQSLNNSPKNYVLDIRIRNIIDYHTYAVYRNVSSALFVRHQLLFSFYICVKILEDSDKTLSNAYDLLVRGGVVVSRENQPPNPTTWLSKNSWNAIVDLEVIPELSGIVQSFTDTPEQWEEWFLESTPENSQPFGDPGNLNPLTRLLLIRAMREDRLSAAITNFVEQHMGPKYLKPPVFDLRHTFEESSPTIPLIFILSPGADPTASFVQFAETHDMQNSLLILSLGQGQAEIAVRSIEKGVREGCWVFLANCHLSLSWMPALSKLIEDLKSLEEIHPNFRLWLSSSPSKGFPISILQDGIKMTTEPPQGLKGNVTRLYQSITSEQFGRCLSRVNYPRLLFALSLFHAVLLERRKFQQLGWNVIYSFNDSDFEISENLLTVYLDEYESTPWEALKFLIAEISYGGHVTDTWDRRLLMTYGNQFLNEYVTANSELRLSSSLTFAIPTAGTLESAKEFIESLPGVDPPEAFGQDSNAEINFLIMESRSVCDTLLSMQSSGAAKAAGSFEDKALTVAEDILSHLPEIIDLKASAEALSPLGPLEIVLLQEGSRYNNLLSTMSQSLNDVKRAVKGQIVLSQELEEIAMYLFNGKVPLVWLKAYASLKPLGSWTRDLIERMDMFHLWVTTFRPPLLFWPTAFTFPTALLTAVLQQTARNTGVSVDVLSWDFQIIEGTADSITRPEVGILVRGLFLEGAGWDYKNNCLCDPPPMQLICNMPVIWFKPKEESKTKNKRLYNCPAYYFPIRCESFVVAVDLMSGNYSPDVWVKRGTALLLSTDS